MSVQNAALFESLKSLADKTRVYVSMPYIPGISPAYLDHASAYVDRFGVGRREGIFRLNEIGLSPLDHGGLYGDGAFEGIRVDNRCVLMLEEHVARWFDSLAAIGIESPETCDDMCGLIREVCRETLVDGRTSAYLRPVMTRGIGNLGINPAKCYGPTVYIICSTISLYPESCYSEGIDIAVARGMRRNGPTHLNPNIKSLNYLNNILALLETRTTGAMETLMLTDDGYVAEATADNLFVAEMLSEGLVRLKCPAKRYALGGLTRWIIMDTAARLGWDVVEDDHMLTTDLVGPSREVFITGTACGMMPVRSVDGVGCAHHRPLFDMLRGAYNDRVSSGENSVSIDGPGHVAARRGVSV